MIAPEGLAKIVLRAQVGDREAQAALLERIRPDLDRFSQQLGNSSTAAESAADLAQEGALRFWEKFRQFQGTVDDESTAAMLHDWLQQLVRRLAANRHEARHAAKRRPDGPILRLGVPATNDSQGDGLDPAGRALTPSAIVGAAEIDERVQTALTAIPDPIDRQIVELCFLHGLSLRGVAGQLNVGYDEVRTRYHAALRFLERELEGLL